LNVPRLDAAVSFFDRLGSGEIGLITPHGAGVWIGGEDVLRGKRRRRLV